MNPEQRTRWSAVAPAFTDTLDRGAVLILRSALHWQAETARTVNDLNSQSEAMLVRLFNSKTPLDVLAAQQEWLGARRRSLFEAGLRWVDTLAEAASAGKGKQGAAPSTRPKSQ